MGIGRFAFTPLLPLMVRDGSLAQSAAAQAAQADRPVIVFVHGNFENAGFWQELIWRFESNDYPANRLFTFELENPVAMSTGVGTNDKSGTPGRSSLDEATAARGRFLP